MIIYYFKLVVLLQHRGDDDAAQRVLQLQREDTPAVTVLGLQVTLAGAERRRMWPEAGSQVLQGQHRQQPLPAHQGDHLPDRRIAVPVRRLSALDQPLEDPVLEAEVGLTLLISPRLPLWWFKRWNEMTSTVLSQYQKKPHLFHYYVSPITISEAPNTPLDQINLWSRSSSVKSTLIDSRDKYLSCHTFRVSIKRTPTHFNR